MKNCVAWKVLVLFFTTIFLLTALVSALGMIILAGTGLYNNTPKKQYELYMTFERQELAVDLVYTYAALNLGGIPAEYFDQYYDLEWQSQYFREDYYFYSIFDENGVMVESAVTEDPEGAAFYEIELTDLYYRRLVDDASAADPTREVFTDDYFDEEHGCYVQICYATERLPDYTVQLYMLDGVYRYDGPWQLLQQLYPMRYHLFWVFGAAMLLFIVCVVCLCCTAGRKRGSSELRPGGLNRLPLDLYTAAAAVIVVLVGGLGGIAFNELVYSIPRITIYLLLLLSALISLTVAGLIFAWAAQLKMRNGYWLKNTVIGRIFHWIGRGLRWTFRALHSLFRLLPVIWQWVLTAVLMALVPFVFFMLYLFSMDYNTGAEVLFLLLFILSVCGDVFVTLYGAWCFGLLMKGATRMSRGDLSAKISTKRLLGSFRDFALHLNALSEAASLAAERQMRSERMKTELITNVSHDIKTPLTSIINFVDLLQKPHTPEQEQEYLEVLSRQSAQMKKLIEDLMELSKANSGSLTVNLQKMDAVEAVNQALGEFSDKLESAGLTPVFRQPEHPVYITADGRHMWRVLFNLLTNAVKYALPGTRLYIDLMQADHSVVLSLKNVSRAELNISAEELMERFVQGDASRKSEGSGLGLNIAKSLMEVQHGHLQLLLDGDLFKVTLTFPAAEA